MVLKISISIFLLYMVIQTKGDKCENAVADIAIILDASVSIWGPDFDKQLAFVEDLATLVGVGRSKTQISVITFADTVVPIFDFNTHPSEARIMNAIKGIEHLNGPKTFTHAALKYVRKHTFLTENGARPDVPHIVILLTDGMSSNRNFTKVEAALLKKEGVQVFAIGIGRRVSETELETIASEPKENFVIRVRNFNALKGKNKFLAYKACEVTTVAPTTTPTTTPATTTTTTTTTEPTTTTTTTTTMATTTEGITEDLKRLCGGKPADVVFVLDKSSSIGSRDFPKQLAFVNNLVEAFDIGKDTTRVGVVSFSDLESLKIEFPLNAFDEAEDIQYAVSNIYFSGGGTNTAAAIDVTMRHMFTPQYGSRPEVAHVAVIITDGQSMDPIETYKAAKASHSRGIYLFAIGVGSQIDKTELKDIASNPNKDFMFTVDNYDSLNSIRNLLAKKTCGVEQPQRDVRLCGGGQTDADIIFSLDTGNLGGKELKAELDFIKGVSNRLDIDSARIRVGMVRMCPKLSEIKLKTSTTRQDFQEKLASFGQTDLQQVINETSHRGFSRWNGGRSYAKRKMVLFVNGPISDYRGALGQALFARVRKDIEIFVVAVGGDINRQQLDNIYSKPPGEHVFHIKTTKELALIQHKLEERLCSKL